MAEVRGSPELIRNLRLLGDKAPHAAAGGLWEAAEVIMRDAKERTPVKWGNLRASGHVENPEVRGTEARVRAGFGGPAGAGNVGGETNREHVGYAVYVHELGPREGGVGEKKFLERAVQAKVSEVPNIVARHVAYEVRRRGVA